jgi:hypothetical protein
MAAGTGIHTRNVWILHRSMNAINCSQQHSIKAGVVDQDDRRRNPPKRTDLPNLEHVRGS